MLPNSLALILFASSAGILAVLYFTLYRRFKTLIQSDTTRESEVQGKLYETRLLDELHLRLGYSINTKNVLDAIIASFPKLLEYSAASYVLIEGSKIYYKSHLDESVSKKYVEKTKDLLLETLKNSNPSVIGTESIEEEISGSLLNGAHPQEIASSFDISLVVNTETVGILNVSSTKPNQYKKNDIDLITRIVDRAMNEISQLQQLLNHEKTKLEAMVENMRDGVVMIDDDFKILAVNPACLRVIEKTDVSNVSIFDVVGYFSKIFPLAQMISDVFDKGLAKSVNDVKFGTQYYDVLVVPVKTESSIDAVGVIIHDKTKEHELIALREDFTSMIVHELRAPLTVIMDTADLISKHSGELSSEQSTTLLNQMQTSSGGLLAIVNDLLDTAKLEAGKLELIKRPGDLNKLLSDQVNYFKHLAQKKGITLQAELDTSISEFGFDENKIKQVMNNLLSNAIKFTDEGYVRVQSKKLQSAVEVTVADTGAGISKENKQKLFNKFEQVGKSLSSEEKGTGLGLVITKGLVEAHGGEIHLQDNEPHGTKLVFTLPIS